MEENRINLSRKVFLLNVCEPPALSAAIQFPAQFSVARWHATPLNISFRGQRKSVPDMKQGADVGIYQAGRDGQQKMLLICIMGNKLWNKSNV